MKYKLVMFGFSSLCLDLDEARSRLAIIPKERAIAEGIDQCYIINLETGGSSKINLEGGRYKLEKEV